MQPPSAIICYINITADVNTAHTLRGHATFSQSIHVKWQAQRFHVAAWADGCMLNLHGCVCVTSFASVCWSWSGCCQVRSEGSADPGSSQTAGPREPRSQFKQLWSAGVCMGDSLLQSGRRHRHLWRETADHQAAGFTGSSLLLVSSGSDADHTI